MIKTPLLLLLFFVLLLNCGDVFSSGGGNVNAKNKTILFIVAWQKSHILAGQGIAEEMVQRGYRVLFSTTENDKHLLSCLKTGVEFLNAGAVPNTDEYYNYGHTIEDLFRGQAEYARSMYDHLLPILQKGDLKVDLIVSDIFTISAEALAEKLGVLHVQFGPLMLAGARWNSYSSPTYPALISGLPQKGVSYLDRAKNSLLILVCSYVLPVVRGLIQNDFRRYAGLAPTWSEFQNPYGFSKPLLVGRLFGFELPQSVGPQTFLTGPFLPRSHRPLDDGLKQWLDNHEGLPLVFISIGTNAVFTPKALSALVDAVLIGAVKESRFRVLWSIKSEQQKMIDSSKLLQLESSRNVRIVNFVEQLAVLSHPSTKVFFSHAGWGSIAESIYHGVPLVLMPMMLVSDQPTNAARAHELGLGVWIDRRLEGEINSSQALDAINRVLPDDSSFRREVKRFQQLFHLFSGREKGGDLLESFLHPINYSELLQPVDAHFWSNFDIYIPAILLLYVVFRLIHCILCCGKKSSTHKKQVKRD